MDAEIIIEKAEYRRRCNRDDRRELRVFYRKKFKNSMTSGLRSVAFSVGLMGKLKLKSFDMVDGPIQLRPLWDFAKSFIKESKGVL